MIAVAVAALALAGCGDDDDTEGDTIDLAEMQEAADNAAPCPDVFAPGRPTADVVADIADNPCKDGDEVRWLARVHWPCPDGTEVHQVDPFGWGRDGDVWQGPDVPAPYADCVMPGTDAQHP